MSPYSYSNGSFVRGCWMRSAPRFDVMITTEFLKSTVCRCAFLDLVRVDRRQPVRSS